MKRVEFILYVEDQAWATAFYRALFESEPTLNVPGMTEFELAPGVFLGLMPSAGIVRLLGDAIPDPRTSQVPRAELYLSVDDPEQMVQRAVELGARLLSPVEGRDWGDRAGYVADLDGHVLAFASS